MSATDKIVTNFNMLKAAGLKAKNPDQSSSMLWSFNQTIKICRFKGFSKKDIKILFKTAMKRNKTKRHSYNGEK